jgi:putative FmdB family regulatory protein
VPIYEYRCSSCGFQKEYLQRVSDPLMSVCPECGKQTFDKLLTAAGFQLKGGGWYATDFKHSGTKPGAKTSDAGAGAAKSETSESKGGASTAPAAPAPAAPASPAKAE